MDENEWLAGRFEASRPRLRGVAYRMLGSLSEAEDAVQEAWIHAAGAGADNVSNLEGWLTTIVARVCLDMLRARKSRREEPLGVDQAVAAAGPEQEAVLADSVGLAMLVVLDTLAPAERVAFVLHDMFGLPFGEISEVTGRSSAATRQLASRARRRVRGTAVVPGTRLARQRELAAAYLAAARGGDLGALLSILDPEVELQADGASVPSGVPVTLRGAAVVAGTALTASGRSRYAGLALIDGSPGIIMAPAGRLALVLAFTFGGDRITRIEVIAEPDRLGRLDLEILRLPAAAVGSAGRVGDDHGERRDHQGHHRDGDRRGHRVPVQDRPGQDEQADADRHEDEVQALIAARRLRSRPCFPVWFVARHERQYKDNVLVTSSSGCLDRAADGSRVSA
jgi:RNA polymerase sigma factor (sigma-70 family)